MAERAAAAQAAGEQDKPQAPPPVIVLMPAGDEVGCLRSKLSRTGDALHRKPKLKLPRGTGLGCPVTAARPRLRRRFFTQ